MMPLEEVTRRTKVAVRKWAGLPPNAKVVLDDPLDKFKDNDMDGLRVKTNAQFTGENGFPIKSKEWEELDPKTVRNVRDEANRRVNGPES